MENLYHTLDILPTATQDEIKAAYLRIRAKLLASGGDESEMTPQLLEIDKAYAVLIDPNERAKYDRSLGTSNVNSQSSLAVLEKPQIILQPETAAPPVQRPCPYCGSPNPIQASICNHCGQQITRPCPNCGHDVQLGQPVCPRCDTFLPEYDQRRLAQALIVEQKTQTERLESESRVQTLEAGHRIRAVQGVVFWIIVVFGCIALTIVPILIFNYILAQP